MKAATLPLTAGMAAQAHAIAATLPQMRTAQTLLRAPRLADFDAYRAIACSDRGKHIGGPMAEAAAWDDFCRMTATWVLRGHGAWAVSGADDHTIGFVLIGLEPGDAEPELGYLFLSCSEGQGLAHEAASAARDHAFGTLGLATLVSYIDPANTRALALARRLGGRADGVLDGCAVWRMDAAPPSADDADAGCTGGAQGVHTENQPKRTV